MMTLGECIQGSWRRWAEGVWCGQSRRICGSRIVGGSSWLEDIRDREAVFKEGEGFGHRASSLLGVKILGGR